MLPVPRIGLNFGNLLERARAKRVGPLDRGFAWSMALHAAIIALLIFVLPWLQRPRHQIVEAIPVDLVSVGERTTAPERDEKAQHPQDMPTESAKPEPHRPEPVSEAPPPKSEPTPRPDVGPKPDPLADIRPERKPAPPGPDIDTPPKSRAKIDIERPIPPNPQSENRPGPAALTVTMANAPYGPQATISAKDFLRAQIERHWNFDVASLGSADLVVSIHILLRPDGNVTLADIVDDPHYASNPLYHEAAASARRAVLVAAPLQIPAGRYSEFQDVTVSLDPKDALR